MILITVILVALAILAKAENEQKRQILVPSFFKQMLAEAEREANKRPAKRTILMPSFLQQMLREAERHERAVKKSYLMPYYLHQMVHEAENGGETQKRIPILPPQLSLALKAKPKRNLMIPSFLRKYLREKGLNKRTMMPAFLREAIARHEQKKSFMPSFLREALSDQPEQSPKKRPASEKQRKSEKRTSLIPSFFQRLLKAQEDKHEKNRIKRDTFQKPTFLQRIVQHMEQFKNDKRGLLPSHLSQYNELLDQMQSPGKRGLVQSQLSQYGKLLDEMDNDAVLNKKNFH